MFKNFIHPSQRRLNSILVSNSLTSLNCKLYKVVWSLFMKSITSELKYGEWWTQSKTGFDLILNFKNIFLFEKRHELNKHCIFKHREVILAIFQNNDSLFHLFNMVRAALISQIWKRFLGRSSFIVIFFWIYKTDILYWNISKKILIKLTMFLYSKIYLSAIGLFLLLLLRLK